jgi:hypothetical protein
MLYKRLEINYFFEAYHPSHLIKQIDCTQASMLKNSMFTCILTVPSRFWHQEKEEEKLVF